MAQYVDADYISKQEEHTIGGIRLLSSPFVLRGRNTNKPQRLFPAYVNRDPFFNSRPWQISIPFSCYLFFGREGLSLAPMTFPSSPPGGETARMAGRAVVEGCSYTHWKLALPCQPRVACAQVAQGTAGCYGSVLFADRLVPGRSSRGFGWSFLP